MKSAPTIYVANGSLQHHVLQYICPRTRQPRHLRIGAGRQEAIANGYNVDELHQIVAQLERYHDEVATVGELKNVKSAHGLIFCLDKPIQADTINERIETEKALAQEVASEEAERAGLAAFAAAKSRVGTVNETSLEVVQEDERGNAAQGRAVDFEVAVSTRASRRTDEPKRRTA